MTQLSLVTTELGWGDLNSELGVIKVLREKIQKDRKSLKRDETEFYHLVEEINKNRKKRVLELLKKEGRGICLFHPRIFRELGIEESLVPKDDLKIVKIFRSWTTTTRSFDGDETYGRDSKETEISACGLCRNFAHHAKYVDERDSHVHTILDDREPETETIEELYPEKIIDQISLEYFQMPPVSIKNLQSL